MRAQRKQALRQRVSGRTTHLESRPPDERTALTLLLWWIGEADPICQVPAKGGDGILIQIGGGPRLAINSVAARQCEELDVCAYDVHKRSLPGPEFDAIERQVSDSGRRIAQVGDMRADVRQGNFHRASL